MEHSEETTVRLTMPAGHDYFAVAIALANRVTGELASVAMTVISKHDQEAVSEAQKVIDHQFSPDDWNSAFNVCKVFDTHPGKIAVGLPKAYVVRKPLSGAAG